MALNARRSGQINKSVWQNAASGIKSQLKVKFGEAMMPTKTIEVQPTQTYLKELLALVGQGTEIILTQGRTPIARLTPIAVSPTTPRVAGLHPDAIWIRDDFDEPLPDEFWLGHECV